MRKITIAIDGFSSCGKSTMAKDLACEVGYTYVDTGAMYRAVALYALRHGLVSDSGEVDVAGLEAMLDDINVSFKVSSDTGKAATILNGENVEKEIRSLVVSDHVSKIASIPFVRRRLVALQREMGKAKGIVMDGRDIGTIVFPDAEMKVFVTARAEIRAQRRYEELKAKGIEADYEDILNNVKKRDYLDTHRAISPLRQASDAVLLDNSTMSIEDQNRWLVALYTERAEV